MLVNHSNRLYFKKTLTKQLLPKGNVPTWKGALALFGKMLRKKKEKIRTNIYKTPLAIGKEDVASR